jgi:hypothetical protein
MRRLPQPPRAGEARGPGRPLAVEQEIGKMQDIDCQVICSAVRELGARFVAEE